MIKEIILIITEVGILDNVSLDVKTTEGINEISLSLMEGLSVVAVFTFPSVCKGRLLTIMFSSIEINFATYKYYISYK
jgi:hypothetical protein